MDTKRYKWHEIVGKNERWLVDKNEHDRVVAIVAEGCDEVIPPVGGPDDEREPTKWWGVFSPFRKKAVSQHLTEKDAVKYAQDNMACGKKEERIPWESES